MGNDEVEVPQERILPFLSADLKIMISRLRIERPGNVIGFSVHGYSNIIRGALAKDEKPGERDERRA